MKINSFQIEENYHLEEENDSGETVQNWPN